MVTSAESSVEPPTFVVSVLASTTPWNLVAPVLLAATSPSFLTAPSDLAKVTSPEPALRVRFWVSSAVPSTTSAKVIAPFVVLNTIFSVSVTAVAKPKAALEDVKLMSPARLFAPAPVWLNAPAAVMSPAAIVVNAPALATVTAPPVVTAAFTVSALPVKESAPASVVAAPIVVVPVPACCVRLAAVKAALMPTFLAETNVTAPSAPLVAV